MKKCPNCQHPVAPDSAFCENCGFDLRQAPAEAQRQPQQRADKPAKHKTWLTRTVWGILAVALIAVLALGYSFYNKQAGKEQQVANMADMIRNNQSGDLAKVMVSDNPNLKITGDTVQPLLTYARAHQHYAKTLQEELMSSGESRDQTFKLETDGHTMLIFPIYKLRVRTMHPVLSTNVANATLEANGSPLVTAKNDHFTYTAGPLFPGHYTFKLSDSRNKATKSTDLMKANDVHKQISLLTTTQTNGKDTVNQDDTTDNDEQPTADDSANTHHTGKEASDLSDDAQEAIDAASDDYDFDVDDNTYTVSVPADDMLEIKAYDKFSGQHEGTFRYDQIHNIVSEYNPDTDKFETND
ncbi:TcaA second domain-containing protein [Levilactobacillus tujiorum]|uniref:TcaA second domain-containing protein n=1 Tax=Levilactobacillus tujiorum TaxID=2912243 RepID=UPI001456A80B|nr:zinc-ribbon domain-containing protein [Levilactobacillus tujiorum]NLR32068.1 zinc ribbon domain-containing protein [Levilactobacillus tujiorum]